MQHFLSNYLTIIIKSDIQFASVFNKPTAFTNGLIVFENYDNTTVLIKSFRNLSKPHKGSALRL